MSRFDYDLIVLGTGAGGSTAAHIAAAAGKKVAVVEKDTFGGECPNYADIPTKALLAGAKKYADAMQAARFGVRTQTIGYNYPTLNAWKESAIARTGTARGKATFESAGINVLRGTASFASAHEVMVGRRYYQSQNFLIATGATPFVPQIEGLDTTPTLSPHEATALLKPPKSLAIIGGGATGVEFAELFNSFGTKVTILEIAPRLLPQEDRDLGTYVSEQLRNRGVQVQCAAKVVEIASKSLQKEATFRHADKEHTIKVDQILLATGRSPAVAIGLERAGVAYSSQGIAVNGFLQTNVPHIYAAGDVTTTTHYTPMAVHQSRVAAHNMWHKQKMPVGSQPNPRVFFTNPEVAAVGATEEVLQKTAQNFSTATCPLSLTGRANTDGWQEGFVKVIVDDDGRLIGGVVAAPHAGEIIHELALAIHLGATAEALAAMVHAFPTWSEALRIACSRIR